MHTPTPTPTPTSTPVPPLLLGQESFTFQLGALLEEYELNKVLANTKFRYVENAQRPITVSGFVQEVEPLYVKISAEPGQIWGAVANCFYADTREALHVSKDQPITVTGRVSGVEYGDVIMFMCDIHEVALESSPALTPNDVHSNVVRVHCESGSNLLGLLRGASYGTGVIVDSAHGLVLTAHHVVEDDNECERILVEPLLGGGRTAATVVKHCASVDQAYLSVEAEAIADFEAPYLYPASAPAQVDQTVYFWAWGSEGLRWQSGIVDYVSSYEIDRARVDTYAVPGDSGSPVFNEHGHLLGILTTSNASD